MKDFTLNGINYRASDNTELVFVLGYYGFDPKQWKSPYEFRPERFDPKNSEWFLTPEGK
jgi:cytochrome P450